MFIDRVRVSVTGGRGGSGVTSFERQPFEPRGRPDGGDGGHGGAVTARASHDVATLVDYHHRPHRKAGSGAHGSGDLRRGADGDDVVLVVPVGTVVTDDDGALLADLDQDGAEVVLAKGGRGGRGNAAFRTANRRAPRFHENGEPTTERWVRMELKLPADVALVGFPNAGKSSVIARLSAARPKIADYPFTTLTPNLGVVRAGDLDFTVADVPGLIEGASEGRGLGHEFLRHTERAGALVHVLDCASYEQRDPREDLQTVVDELTSYAGSVGDDATVDLIDRPAIVFANKADVAPETAEAVAVDLRARGWEVLIGSAVTGDGMEPLRWRMAELVATARAEAAEARAATTGAVRPVLRPAGTRDDLVVERRGAAFHVGGERVERWVVMTDLSNDEAVRHLQDRLARAGVERRLIRLGARAGDAVEIGGYVFDFDPELADLPHDEQVAIARAEAMARGEVDPADPADSDDAAEPDEDDPIDGGSPP